MIGSNARRPESPATKSLPGGLISPPPDADKLVVTLVAALTAAAGDLKPEPGAAEDNGGPLGLLQTCWENGVGRGTSARFDLVLQMRRNFGKRSSSSYSLGRDRSSAPAPSTGQLRRFSSGRPGIKLTAPRPGRLYDLGWRRDDFCPCLGGQ